MKQNTAPYQTREFKQAEFIKDPYMIEFLGLPEDERMRESTLEAALLANLQSFLLELGKGYAFMGRQFHLRGISGNYYIDLVFYNVILKCYVLIDLKVGKVTHQDAGQMDMYVRMFDDFYRRDDDSPTLGIVLCSDTDADIARYSILAGSEQLFASKYKLYLPTNEELRAEIESQKALFEQRITGKRGTPDPPSHARCR
ncbi:PDDEXK nuclease domain-containing protein [Collinsella tanakaei]|uniref:PDDEXK nuclease domain-containing protein n=1 Tax=Collinsella tanakaei TaxID=626935 RepID=UPI0025A384B9|nr:PDDEXK nuclease domain-containing protein [Collinsella tanakaei]MDM8246361.1 PDDEXK nuclease domain-containing protein [Collinsella tanakaei]